MAGALTFSSGCFHLLDEMGSRIIIGARGRGGRVGDLRMEERNEIFLHETGERMDQA